MGTPFKPLIRLLVSSLTVVTLLQPKTYHANLAGITTESLSWSPYATTPAGQYVLRLDDTSGQTAFSQTFTMLGAGTNPSSTGLHFTNPSFNIVAGSNFLLTWAGASGSTTVTLMNGTGNNMNTVDVVYTTSDSSLNWTPYANTPVAQYVLQLADASGQIAYSTLFTMEAAGSSPNSGTTSEASSAALTTAELVPPPPPQTESSSSPSSTIKSQVQSSSSLTQVKSQTTSSAPQSTTTSPTTTVTGALISKTTNSPVGDATTSSSSTSTPQSSSSSFPVPITNDATTSSGLSTGAKAGVGIACALGVIGLVTAIVMYTWRLRQKKVEEKEEFFGGNSTMSYGVSYEGPPKFSSLVQPAYPPTEMLADTGARELSSPPREGGWTERSPSGNGWR
jgi:hypothetical protein